MGTARDREGPYYGAIHIRLHICAARSPSRNHRSPFFSSDSMRTKYEHFRPASTLFVPHVPKDPRILCRVLLMCMVSDSARC